ncbi:hypothetical protein JOQ06_020161 [Pogonophryne albipinna]|uniref:Uncharacterized protein n=1 Tax=Pogonophryne albipinna TaxID=1090488 RepID=A0AAD6BT66_9TELE|nr:hypothetical protein JOQ06_020161 [Pogonophryne albipinna]
MKTLVVFVFFCASMALAGAAAQSPSSNACPEDWTEFDGRCFQYVHKGLSWAKAEVSEENISTCKHYDDF